MRSQSKVRVSRNHCSSRGTSVRHLPSKYTAFINLQYNGAIMMRIKPVKNQEVESTPNLASKEDIN